MGCGREQTLSGGRDTLLCLGGGSLLGAWVGGERESAPGRREGLGRVLGLGRCSGGLIHPQNGTSGNGRENHGLAFFH